MGILALMGSGELTATMVEVHKLLLSPYRPEPQAMFLDTPAGFQLNADQIGENAVGYFKQRVGCPLQVASYKSAEMIPEIEAARTYRQLRQADYLLMGPGSPTYTVRQLKDSPIPEIMIELINRGGCLVAASAAALTTGRYTLPVYEIYKVGEPPHWVEGLDLLGAFGLPLVVIPHWNNAEGGTHDTSRCFMGSSRFEQLVDRLDEPLPVLGLDEHTAIIIDFSADAFTVHGIGTVVLQLGSSQLQFTPGITYPLKQLHGENNSGDIRIEESRQPVLPAQHPDSQTDFWPRLHSMTADFQQGIEEDDLGKSAHALLEMDRLLWQALGELENPEAIAQARDFFREKLAEMGTCQVLSEAGRNRLLAPLIDSLLEARQHFRKTRQFEAADMVRDALSRAAIVVEDTANGSRWRIEEDKE
ncbi:MAG: hypothetical protein KJN87_06615 [Desulfofustis sp.]|nr:hypothetical protein [Desulfofustis sp.]